MNFLYFYDFGPLLIKGLVGIVFLKFVYIIWALSKQAKEELRQKAEAGFDKEAFYRKYRKIYADMPPHEKGQKRENKEESEEIKAIPSPQPRYAQEYHFFTSDRTPFEILGVKPGASFAQIKKRYRILAAKWHPDKYISLNLSKEELDQVTCIAQIINLAYETLEKRYN